MLTLAGWKLRRAAERKLLHSGPKKAMATNITKKELENGRVELLVGGELLDADARLVAKLASEAIDNGALSVIIDVADVDLLDSDSAPILRDLERDPRISLRGIEIFLQYAVSEAERH